MPACSQARAKGCMVSPMPARPTACAPALPAAPPQERRERRFRFKKGKGKKAAEEEDEEVRWACILSSSSAA